MPLTEGQVGDEPAMVVDVREGDAPALEQSRVVPEEPAATPADEAVEPVETPEEQRADQAAEAAGGQAATAGQARSSNPFDGRTTEGKAWARGWDAASKGEPAPPEQVQGWDTHEA